MKTEGKKRHLSPLFICVSISCSVIFTVNTKLVTAGSPGPNFFYYSSGRKIPLPVSKEMLAVRFKPGVPLEQQRTIVESEPSLASFFEREELSIFKLTLLPLREQVTKEDAIQTINSLNTKLEVEFASAVFHFPDAELIVTDEFLVKFDPSVSEAEIRAFNVLNNVEIVEKAESTGWYTLRVKEPRNMNTLKTANLYYEDRITLYSVPNFVMRLEPMSVTPDDTYFEEQWALNNTGQTGGTPNADMDAPAGWQITTGSCEIIIAIIDSGVELIHADLITKLVDGRDCIYDDNDPSPVSDDAHGTACAGLAAADTNNATGVAGVCWNCKIMPVRVFENNWTNYDILSKGIKWAADNGADVLSNSWGGGPSNDKIHSAIIHAKNNGRDGKGCVIVFASGNGNGPVSYPAKYDEVIAVGATDHNDVRWAIFEDWGSNYGSELDVVAPSAWGPVDFCALRRLASIWASVAMRKPPDLPFTIDD